MEDYPNYKFFRGSAEGERAPGKDELAYYAVAFDAIPNRDSFSVAVSSMQTAITFRFSSEVANRNARVLAISFSRKMLR